MKANRSAKAPQPKPKGWIYGARWANVPVDARACTVTVGVSPPHWWCHALTGQERKAVEVQLPRVDGTGFQTVYFDNSTGWVLSVFLRGLAPLPGFQQLPAFFVRDDPDAKPFYRADFGGLHLEE